MLHILDSWPSGHIDKHLQLISTKPSDVSWPGCQSTSMLVPKVPPEVLPRECSEATGAERRAAAVFMSLGVFSLTVKQ